MKRYMLKKLRLTAETLRTLQPGALAHVAGGLGGGSAAPEGGPIGNSCNSCPCQQGSAGCPM
jgi:hypothetical protein